MSFRIEFCLSSLALLGGLMWSAGDALALDAPATPVVPPAGAQAPPPDTASPSRLVPVPGTALPNGPAGRYSLVLNEEFQDAQLNEKLWNYNLWFPGSINKEQQFYRPENVRMADGKLIITARKEVTVTGWPGDAPPRPQTLPYTSGLIQTRGKWEGSYGVYEARIKLPAGKGFFPAFWLKAHPTQPGQAPAEIDIMENLGHEPRIYMSYHYSREGRAAHSGGNWKAEDVSSAFHTYTVEWSPESIRWYVDGVERRPAFTEGAAIARGPMFILLNLAVGSGWSGLPDDNTQFPQTMEVDYVRVWQKGGDS